MSAETTDSVVSSAAATTESAESALERLRGMVSTKQLRSIVESSGFTIALWIGAVSAGKTFASLIAFLIAIRQVPEGERIVIVGVTLKTIEGNILSQLMDEKRFGIIAKSVIHTTGSSTAIILGRTVELIGAPNKASTSKITGATIALAYVDEAVLIPEEFFDMLETRLRVDGARMLATTNPGSFNHWLRVKYIKSAADHDMVVFYFQMRDNPSLTKAYILRMIRANVGMFFQRFILGLWTNAAGAIYDMWDPELHTVPWSAVDNTDGRATIKLTRILCIGIDVGSSHATSAVMLGVTDEYDERGRYAPRLIAIAEWRHKVDHEAGVASKAPSVMAAEIIAWRAQIARALDHPIPRLVYVDPSARGFRDELGRQHVPNNEADNDVLPGISDISSLLSPIKGRPRLIITDACEGILSEISEYSWDAKKTAEGEDEPVKENDDSVDALRYAIRSTRGAWLAIFRAAYRLAA